ncbi:two component response regulator [Agrobacterium sp. ATCC 31749]|uniref:response regulator transcription factor n=1 Tax=Agrobacterium TaxID=357 RepID=UPI00020DB727|nr:MULTISPECIES: response regulator transcription factor [Agrobacterium]AYM59583.1 two component response regulator [Agrobacterium fabrum]AYM64605.1 two component response regulator [Agrobacterium fabrum]EGL64270.1 two component response regulator [Agrobacterium sp. ATCC 31749]NSZ13654.1 response regulator transcription factor [Agrobacterium fabrum]NTB09478.1 response regulator transcription factor [Agrobacterium fabrum]
MRLLLVEDEREMAAALSAALHRFDIIVDTVGTLDLARHAIMDSVHDLVVLDRQLPDGDGIQLIEDLRLLPVTPPVIVLTAQGGLADRINGLNLGADDYLAKPFAVEELLARIRALMRRPAGTVKMTARLGGLEFCFETREVRIKGEFLPLTRRELLILEALLRRQGRTVLRSMLEEAVYNFDDEIQSNALDSHISRLRRKLAAADAGVEVHGIRGVGYLMRTTV